MAVELNPQLREQLIEAGWTAPLPPTDYEAWQPFLTEYWKQRDIKHEGTVGKADRKAIDDYRALIPFIPLDELAKHGRE